MLTLTLTLTLTYGYQFSDTQLVKLITGYADDIVIRTNLENDNQEVLNSSQEWLRWTKTMTAKPKSVKRQA